MSVCVSNSTLNKVPQPLKRNPNQVFNSNPNPILQLHSPPNKHPMPPKRLPTNSWTEVIKRSKKVRNPADVTDKHRQAITRGFNLAPEGPKGYTTVYFNRSRRFTRTEVRNNLHLIKADASRIIDVTFPARNIIGVLVHLQYKDNLVSILTKNNINVVEGFDPTDPKHLADPKFKEMSLSKREDAAFDLQINRCAKSLVYLANRRSRLLLLLLITFWKMVGPPLNTLILSPLSITSLALWFQEKLWLI
ncbi:DNA mismatch repair protein msh6 [Mucor velutinosus]|uniref:DNA mismatch repair protein msh6 n=1 Tax=Mucor velutinosus TaxID=708070 RepID=A0AAN7HKS3_9FUNG|nr:DNA mismatch repair protein msh6 [Mucor velutinosus]